MRHTEPHDNGYNRVGFIIYPHTPYVDQNFTWYNGGTMNDFLIEENRELRDRNTYLRKKLKEAYQCRDSSAYLNLLTTYQKLLVKNATQQHQIDQLEGTVHRLTVKDRLKMVK